MYLRQISELKDDIHNVNEAPRGFFNPYVAEESIEVIDSLLGFHERASRAEILALLPPRQVADRLLAVFFNQANMSPGLCTRHCVRTIGICLRL